MADEFEEVSVISWTDDTAPILQTSSAIRVAKKMKIEQVAIAQADEIEVSVPNPAKFKSVEFLQRVHTQFLSEIKKPTGLPDPNGGVQAYLNFKMPPGLGDIRYMCYDPRPEHKGDIILAGMNRVIVVPSDPSKPIQVLDSVVDNLTIAYWNSKFYAFATYSALATFEIGQAENHSWISGCEFDNLAGRGVYVGKDGIYFTEIDQTISKLCDGHKFERILDDQVSDFLIHYPSEDLITILEDGSLKSRDRGIIDLGKLKDTYQLPFKMKFEFPDIRQLYTGDIIIATSGTASKTPNRAERGQDEPTEPPQENIVFILVGYKQWKISSLVFCKYERGIGSGIRLCSPKRGIQPIIYMYGSNYILLAAVANTLTILSAGHFLEDIKSALHYTEGEWILGGADTLIAMRVSWS